MRTKFCTLILVCIFFNFGDALKCYHCMGSSCQYKTLTDCNPVMINFTLSKLEIFKNKSFSYNRTNDFKCVSLRLNNGNRKQYQFCTYEKLNICGVLYKNVSFCSYCKTNGCNDTPYLFKNSSNNAKKPNHPNYTWNYTSKNHTKIKNVLHSDFGTNNSFLNRLNDTHSYNTGRNSSHLQRRNITSLQHSNVKHSSGPLMHPNRTHPHHIGHKSNSSYLNRTKYRPTLSPHFHLTQF